MRFLLRGSLAISLIFYGLVAVEEQTTSDRFQERQKQSEVRVPSQSTTKAKSADDLPDSTSAVCKSSEGRYRLQATCQDVCGVCIFVPRGAGEEEVSCRECL